MSSEIVLRTATLMIRERELAVFKYEGLSLPFFSLYAKLGDRELLWGPHNTCLACDMGQSVDKID